MEDKALAESYIYIYFSPGLHGYENAEMDSTVVALTVLSPHAALKTVIGSS